MSRHMRKEFPAYAAATRAVLGEGTDAGKLAAHLVAGRWSPTIRFRATNSD
ncbi:hypothetical protein [Mesorhizobium sp. M0276]|uniref:hypothetical protein n=1 Tax=Mesorhizobium sp. M0276 TaxID=2956928 RepID=UPI0033378A1C